MQLAGSVNWQPFCVIMRNDVPLFMNFVPKWPSKVSDICYHICVCDDVVYGENEHNGQDYDESLSPPMKQRFPHVCSYRIIKRSKREREHVRPQMSDIYTVGAQIAVVDGVRGIGHVYFVAQATGMSFNNLNM